MYILGIETSCDETAAAVVHDGRDVRSNVVASQFDVHAQYGGVVPELASREHLRAIVPVVRQAVEDAALAYPDLDAIAVTYGPGLVGALLVGLTYAKGLAYSLSKPLLGVNHLEGHIHAVVLESEVAGAPVDFPALALVVSGGHSHLYVVDRPDQHDYRYKTVGRTRDDAAGEAYDKVAKLLGFGYPGGPLLDKLAPHGDPAAVPLPSARMKGNPLDLSFTGLKTAVLRYVRGSELEGEIDRRRAVRGSTGSTTVEEALPMTSQATLDLIASFQFRVVEELLDRAVRAADSEAVQSIVVSGGVAANRGLRARFAELPYPVHFPSLGLSTDNAAMIAAAAYPRLIRGERSDFDLRAEPSLALG